MLQAMTRPVDRQMLAHKAATHAYLWAGAVKHTAAQLLMSDADEAKVLEDDRDLRSAARQSHALLFMLALRNVLRAAEMACRYADPPDRANLRAALASFENRLPGLKEARGALEHFDKYTDVDNSPTPLYEVTFRRRDGAYVISAAGANIDVQAALAEAQHLSSNVVAAAGERWGYPVGNEVE
jgi:hypothetical protein